MLEWKARILILLISLGITADQLTEVLQNNWNW
jgi:hypothetical protein